MRRFYAPIESFGNDVVMFDADETRHLRDVLRLKTGEEVSVFNGIGHEFRCIVVEIEKKRSSLKVIEETVPASPESAFEITVAPTILNGEKYDLIIQKAVELGVTRLIPLHTLRCDVKLKDSVKRLDRWRRIALEATKQSGRAKLMEISEPESFDKLIANSKDDPIVLFSERDGGSFSKIKKGKNLTVIFGPKGGWDDSELELAAKNDITIVTLGGRVLRAETASIAITAILQHRFGDLN
ncbi:MAG: 16S rRNA (uracil(1498)-N(3))-methyltransferase [Acidobacteriota bacterium]